MSKPLLIYDGKCGFCGLWLKYWRALTGTRIAYAPSQEVGAQYPQIPKADFSKAVQLIRADGSVANGARAVFETLGKEKLYQPWPFEWGYALIARHRDAAYHATKWTFGLDIQPARFARTAWIFVRLLALIYGIAFASLAVQVRGLIGERGILPVWKFVSAPSLMKYWQYPTLFWLNPSDGILEASCWLGVAAAAMVMFGWFERTGLAALFILYLSFVSAGQDFMAFQWDALLLEAGFLAIFLQNSRLVVWLFRWLLFRLMFFSGAVKLLSGDKSWRDLTALSYHFWTQPLPNPVAWYVAHAPLSWLKFATGAVLVVELAVPFLIFAPRLWRMCAAWCLIALQALIFMTGNFAFFNLLAAALCVFLFEDRDFERWLEPLQAAKSSLRARRSAQGVAVFVVALGLLRGVETFTGRSLGVVRAFEPFDIVNSYGLFATMTTSRPEIILEGSRDGRTWIPYDFRYKPGSLGEAPKWVAPYQPRLDWQMWFAALGEYRENPWVVNLAMRLLEGSSDVTALLASDPFASGAPKYVRAEKFEYRFTTPADRAASGNWWTREAGGTYLPALSLPRQHP